MNPPQTRYYVHGDESEDDRGAYYCAACDLFAPEEHFRLTGVNSRQLECGDPERYRQHLRRWPQVRKNAPSFSRPTNARNLFEFR